MPVELTNALQEIPIEVPSGKALSIQTLIGSWSQPSTGPRYNAARHSEDLSWAYAFTTGGMLKTGIRQFADVDGRLILFERVAGTDFYSNLEQRYGSAGIAPFFAGQKYLISFYAYSHVGQWFWMRGLTNSTANGHGPKYAPPGRISRHWILGQATSTSAMDVGGSLLALGDGTAQALITLVFQGFSGRLDMWVGGIQIEPVDSAYKDCISLIGDSTMAGGSGKLDLPKDFSIPGNIEVSTVLSALLNAPVFNRAVGGERLDQMDARWATDITPLAARSKYSIIQGGINDISQGRTLAQIQSSIQSMAAKSVADGMIARFLTITPFAAAASDPAKELLRNQVNSWLIDTYGSAAIDINTVAASPWDSSNLHPAGYGDGTHYTGNLKEEIGRYISQQAVWEFIQPGAYRRIDSPAQGADNKSRVVVTDKSGTITTGGTSQTVLSANPIRRGWFIQNTSAGDLWINELGSAATMASPSIKLAAGEMYSPPAGTCTVTSIALIGATTGQTFTAREF